MSISPRHDHNFNIDFESFAPWFQRMQEADSIITIKMVKTRKSDNRLSARSRDGCRVKINYQGYDPKVIPGFLHWMEHNGAAYTIDKDTIVFENMIDADLFWMTFVGIPSQDFVVIKTNSWDNK